MRPTRLVTSIANVQTDHPISRDPTAPGLPQVHSTLHDVLAGIASFGLILLTLVVLGLLAITVMEALYYGWIGHYL
jgi:hypothetical protein